MRSSTLNFSALLRARSCKATVTRASISPTGAASRPDSNCRAACCTNISRPDHPIPLLRPPAADGSRRSYTYRTPRELNLVVLQRTFRVFHATGVALMMSRANLFSSARLSVRAFACRRQLLPFGCGAIKIQTSAPRSLSQTPPPRRAPRPAREPSRSQSTAAAPADEGCPRYRIESVKACLAPNHGIAGADLVVCASVLSRYGKIASLYASSR